MTKVNEGVFIFLAAGLALLSVARNSFLKVYGFWTLAVAGLFLPYLLMRPMLYTPSALSYCVFSTCGIAVAVLMAYNLNREPFLTTRAMCVYALLVGVVAAFPVLFFLLRGTSLYTMTYMIVLQQKGFAALWYAPLETRLTVTQLGIAILPILLLMSTRSAY